MMWNLTYSEKARKQLRKLDPLQRRMVLAWLDKHIDQCDNPRRFGTAMKGNWHGYWRYRIGVYRVLVDIQDDIVRVEVVHLAHRRDVYHD